MERKSNKFLLDAKGGQKSPSTLLFTFSQLETRVLGSVTGLPANQEQLFPKTVT